MYWMAIFPVASFIFLLGLYIKRFLPSYFDEEGKHLATKEDIADITRKMEETERYGKLYGIVIQPEYIRIP